MLGIYDNILDKAATGHMGESPRPEMEIDEIFAQFWRIFDHFTITTAE